MILETKFKPGQEVFLIRGHAVHSIVIQSVVIEITKEEQVVNYYEEIETLPHLQGIKHLEQNLFASRHDLASHLLGLLELEEEDV